jgi:hypothetical protein
MSALHIQTCDRCGGSLNDGYEVREHCRDLDGFTDEEILCGRCADAELRPLRRSDCLGQDPACPCQDGDLCHYRGPDAWPLPPLGTYLQMTAGEPRSCRGSEQRRMQMAFFVFPERIQIRRVRYLEGEKP